MLRILGNNCSEVSNEESTWSVFQGSEARSTEFRDWRWSSKRCYSVGTIKRLTGVPQVTPSTESKTLTSFKSLLTVILVSGETLEGLPNIRT